jgi:large subunit ribosomal protein L18
MDKNKAKAEKNIRRHKKVRAKIAGNTARPRLSVFRSNKGMFVQLIDDLKGVTLLSADSREIKKTAGKIEVASELGKLLATRAKDKKIGAIVFDRGSYRYHGRVKAFAEGARAGGLEF